MKKVLVGLILGLASCAGIKSAVQDSDEAADYRFPVGTQWTYTTRKGGRTLGTSTVRVIKIENGVTHLSYENRDTAGKLTPRSELAPEEGVYWIDKDGLWSGSIFNGKSLGGEMLYKFGSKKGETWVYDLGVLTATHEGLVEVKVPAGAYKQAIQIKVTNDDSGLVAHRIWLVPKVGQVKLTTDPDLSPMTLELEKFETSK